MKYFLLAYIRLALVSTLLQQCSALSIHPQKVLKTPSKLEFDDLIPISGASPFKYCDADFSTDLFNISSLWVWPNPPYISDFWDFTMKGTFEVDLPAKSRVNILVESKKDDPNGGEPIEFLVDFCRFVDKVTQPVDEEEVCPPKKGEALIQRTDFISWGLDEGTYVITAGMFMPSGERLFCIHTEVLLQKEEPLPGLKA